MKMQALKGFAVAAFIVMLGASSAKASSTMLRADIPFDFTVGSATLPAGTYTITEATPGVLQIRNEKLGSDAAFVLANSLESPKPQDSGKLIFNRYGDTYFLNQVWSDISSYSVPKSQSEISLSNELAAENPSHVIPVVVVVSLQ
jgi:hypothetical protein